jgi:hypothetical protein
MDAYALAKEFVATHKDWLLQLEDARQKGHAAVVYALGDKYERAADAALRNSEEAEEMRSDFDYYVEQELAGL